MGMSGSGGGWEYSCSGSLHFKAFVSNSFGKKGNLSVINCIFKGALLCLLNLYSFFWMVLDGLIMS